MNAKKEHLQILIPYEEHSIVEFMKNKSRCDHSLSRKQVGDLIVDNLKLKTILTQKIVVATNLWQKFRALGLVVGNLPSETTGSHFKSGCYLCAEVSSLQ